jgi:hypothetical protein
MLGVSRPRGGAVLLEHGQVRQRSAWLTLGTSMRTLGGEVARGRWGRSAIGSSLTQSPIVDGVAVFECCTTSCLTRWAGPS